MGINLTNFLSSQSKNTKMIDFQDLVEGLMYLPDTTYYGIMDLFSFQ